METNKINSARTRGGTQILTAGITGGRLVATPSHAQRRAEAPLVAPAADADRDDACGAAPLIAAARQAIALGRDTDTVVVVAAAAAGISVTWVHRAPAADGKLSIFLTTQSGTA